MTTNSQSNEFLSGGQFTAATRDWFVSTFGTPTAVQDAAWTAIGGGHHSLVIAPTGSGKTLAAFMHAIDRLFIEQTETFTPAPENARRPATKTRILYISPVKALGADVQRNLSLPLQGIMQARQQRGDAEVVLTVGLRTGDTTTAERARLVRRPPDILITTPESLFLMLTSRARDALRDVSTIIIDEIHAVAGTKRGSHLALSLERLDALLETPAQRIGLSATVRPVERVAEFLGGERPVTIVAPPASRHLDERIVVPVEDMSNIPESEPGEDAGNGRPGSVWPHVEASILDQVLSRRSTIVFANSRGVAERLTARLNEAYAARLAGAGQTASTADSFPSTQYESIAGSTQARSAAATATIARSHHGSVSKEHRAEIEQALKSGELRCVVATSSLELGIDMGLVDLVIQVSAPPSVASALQRVGRAGHQVGGISTGLVYPRSRRDVIDSAVIVDAMLNGRIEAIAPPRNPLDVLAQQTVAAVAMEPLDIDAWYATVCRAAPYRTLPRTAFDATLDMLAGRYPSDDFSGFRPRLVWDRETGQLSARPGAQQLAVTSGGTIPDRGMFSVVLPEGEERAGSRRVGELDEEMVYESRINDVITLGATSWRIQEITRDQVVVIPAPGRSARLPFWRGDGIGRPAELGAAIGAFLGQLEPDISGATNTPFSELDTRTRLEAIGLDGNAIGNMLALLSEQRAATGVLPTDRTLIIERCRDELGDCRLILHSPYGRRVHEPWALAIAQRIRERWKIDPAVVSSDDGIVARLPDTGRVPDAELFLFDPDKLRRTVAVAVGGSALFAARFRECAARALLLARRTPGRRSPLWQQRLRASQLLESARDYPEFPILIETARECLQDVYDLDALDELMRRLSTGSVRLVEVTTEVPSPFATDLLFGYVAQFMYETDVPMAERRASMLALDSTLLGELLGRVKLSELLDPLVMAQLDQELQRLATGYRAKGKEGVADLLREIGPLCTQDVAARLDSEGDEAATFLSSLESEKRVIRVMIGAREHWASIEDAGRLRDALGVPLPIGLPAAFLESTADPLRSLIARFARTRGPFTTGDAASAFGLGASVAEAVLRQIAEQGKLLSGRFGVRRGMKSPPLVSGDTGTLAQNEWVGDEVFRRLRVRSLQAARKATQPVPRHAYARLLLERQGLVADSSQSVVVKGWNLARGALEGQEGVLHVIEQLAGIPLPVSVWEQQILPVRVRDYAPDMLDALLSSGTVLWSGHGRLGNDDGLVAFHLQEFAPETLSMTAHTAGTLDMSPLQSAILELLSGGGAYFVRQLAAQVQITQSQEYSERHGSPDILIDNLHTALWDLVWAGCITNDTLTLLRALAQVAQQPRPRALSSRRRRGLRGLSSAAVSETLHPEFTALNATTLAGRWSMIRTDPLPDTVKAIAWTEGLLDRYAVVTRNVTVYENVPGGFSALQPVFRGMEDTGRVIRGRFVLGLGAAQFAERATVDRLRELAEETISVPTPVALSAVDPGNPFGTILPWPSHASLMRPARRTGAIVVIDGGHLVFYLPQGGRQLFTYIDPDDAAQTEAIAAALAALSTALSRDKRNRFTLELVNGVPVRMSKLTPALKAIGFSSAPKGLYWGN
ncbi:ATP-dependent helicase [Pectobacterium atrosepticum]|uniref:ATP-dependent helicase n=1 Tax=Pectobacterium atrosepticum TaxID=29471 RepID=UPI00039A448E|nr:ATP-dependent helicase [Pectobacterium atrosepticum]GKV84795.1 ATP-dependent helicase [Pectobacterium carotovorum subsp. carotovorum]ATY90348.1 ATP-dependent helicase [Pectobacterium atrosepticum]KMK79539.1 putative ATP-dependent helicase Lhr [Pectobacterium atrosepticum ICMP 1526]MBL0895345.1 ATP-dependent helicase [Pectobacterium atrosepticum]MCA6979157.1 ATP-dependent helicase [Pectobacterium atrosepticum]